MRNIKSMGITHCILKERHCARCLVKLEVVTRHFRNDGTKKIKPLWSWWRSILLPRQQYLHKPQLRNSISKHATSQKHLRTDPYIWKDVVYIKDFFQTSLRVELRNGCFTRSWLDRWIKRSLLCSDFSVYLQSFIKRVLQWRNTICKLGITTFSWWVKLHRSPQTARLSSKFIHHGWHKDDKNYFHH